MSSWEGVERCRERWQGLGQAGAGPQEHQGFWGRATKQPQDSGNEDGAEGSCLCSGGSGSGLPTWAPGHPHQAESSVSTSQGGAWRPPVLFWADDILGAGCVWSHPITPPPRAPDSQLVRIGESSTKPPPFPTPPPYTNSCTRTHSRPGPGWRSQEDFLEEGSYGLLVCHP